MLNQVVLVGRLVKDPDYVADSKDKKRANIVLAVPRSFKNSEGFYETDYIRCVLWNGIAQRTKEYCHSGDLVGIKGRIESSSYDDESGNRKYVTNVVAEKITFLTSKNSLEKEKSATENN